MFVLKTEFMIICSIRFWHIRNEADQVCNDQLIGDTRCRGLLALGCTFSLSRARALIMFRS